MKIHRWRPKISSFLYRKSAMRKVKIFEWAISLTFLKFSRSHVMLPKTSRLTGFCALIMSIGSNFWIFNGNTYQRNWAISSSISMNELLNNWANSLATNTNANVQTISKNKTIKIITLSPFCCSTIWKRNTERLIYKKCRKYSTKMNE